MPVRTFDLDKMPKATRNRVSPIKDTSEWHQTIAHLSDVKAKKGIVVEFHPDTLRIGKSTPERFKRLLIEEMERMGRTDLKTFFRGKDSNGNPVLYIVKAERVGMPKIDAKDTAAHMKKQK